MSKLRIKIVEAEGKRYIGRIDVCCAGAGAELHRGFMMDRFYDSISEALGIETKNIIDDSGAPPAPRWTCCPFCGSKVEILVPDKGGKDAETANVNKGPKGAKPVKKPAEKAKNKKVAVEAVEIALDELELMDADQLRAFAKEQGVKMGRGRKSKEGLLECIKDALTLSDKETDDGEEDQRDEDDREDLEDLEDDEEPEDGEADEGDDEDLEGDDDDGEEPEDIEEFEGDEDGIEEEFSYDEEDGLIDDDDDEYDDGYHESDDDDDDE